MKKIKKEDVHPLAINIKKLQRYNYNFFNCEEVVFFEYMVVKGMAFKKQNEFFHSSETIRQETGIKKHSLNTIIKKFIALEIISIEVKGMPKVKYFTVHFPKIVELFPKIYQLSENGQLQPNFSKHLADFFIPLVDNYQEKNNIKNSKNNNKKEKEEGESESEFALSFFNDFLSKLKYKNKISPAALKFNEIDLFRASNEYEIELLCQYIEKYFKENYSPSLKQFFKFDAISPNKIKLIEELLVEEDLFAEQIINNLQDTYKHRVKMYNDDDDYKRAKGNSKLVVTNRIKEQIKEALKVKSEIEITNAFTSYIDDILKGELEVRKILPYFFSIKDDEYQIIDNNLENFNLKYSYEKKLN